MNTEIKVEAQSIWRKLLVALGHLDCFRAKLVSGKVYIYEPECTGLYYTLNHDFVIVAIGSNQLAIDRTDKFFNTRRNQIILRGILDRNVETVAKNGTLYFRIPTHQVVEPVAA